MSAQFDFTKGPAKVIIERFDYAPTNIGAYLHFKSGDESFIFSLDYALAKKIAKGFTQMVEQVEKANNISFDDRLDNEPAKSPIQINPDDTGKK